MSFKSNSQSQTEVSYFRAQHWSALPAACDALTEWVTRLVHPGFPGAVCTGGCVPQDIITYLASGTQLSGDDSNILQLGTALAGCLQLLCSWLLAGNSMSWTFQMTTQRDTNKGDSGQLAMKLTSTKPHRAKISLKVLSFSLSPEIWERGHLWRPNLWDS